MLALLRDHQPLNRRLVWSQGFLSLRTPLDDPCFGLSLLSAADCFPVHHCSGCRGLRTSFVALQGIGLLVHITSWITPALQTTPTAVVHEISFEVAPR